jgi:DNA-binding NtrC family response regulator
MKSNFSVPEVYKLLQAKFGIIGASKPMLEAVHLLNQAAPTDLAVLIIGETGTGKEVFSNALHGLSARKKYPFVSVNCGAIPESLLESELFGHEKGAFTSANEQRKGFFEVADKGTIFLDEIGEMPIATQVKLLRILETGEFSRLGSSAVRKVDVRLVAATNRDLEQEVINGNFRQDLYFRLKSVLIRLPSLREHPEDIEQLVTHFAVRSCEKINLQYKGISQDALDILRNLPWPGNVRELRNLVETVVALERCDRITPENLRRYVSPALPAPTTYTEPKREQAITITKKWEPSDKIELELLFRTLLELQNQFQEMQRGMHALAIKIDGIQEQIADLSESGIPYAKSSFEEIPDEEIELDIATNEKRLIIAALDKFAGSRRLAAKALGISERTLYRKLDEYEIDK